MTTENQTQKQQLQKWVTSLGPEDYDEIFKMEQIISKTKSINRRTKAGRALTQELLQILNKGARELIEKGAQPF